MKYLFLCPDAGLAFHFFLDKKTKQKNQGLQQFNNHAPARLYRVVYHIIMKI